MANKKITELNELTTPAGADIVAIVDDPLGSTPTTKKVTVTNLMGQASASNLSSYDFNGNAISNFDASINDQTGISYTVQASDNGKVVVLDNASAISVNIPTGLGAGFNCSFIQKGAGQVTFSPSATLNNRQSHTSINGQYGVASIVAYADDTFVLAGDTTT
jgi:hypothetical protein